MNDKELLEWVEARLILQMLDGCAVEEHLGYKQYNPDSWAVSIRADTLSRLLDMAKERNT